MQKLRCPKCRQFYEFEGYMIFCCPSCMQKEDEEYEEVREYVREHSGATILQASNATGVPHARIMQYLKEERLELGPNSVAFLKCHGCNKDILSGIYCSDCKRLFSSKDIKGYGRHKDIDSKMHTAE